MSDETTNAVTENSLTGSINLYYDLHLPEELPAPLLIVLHGYGANKRQMMREARKFSPQKFAIASLQGFHQHIKEPREQGGPLRFGFGWLSNFRPEESWRLHHETLIKLIETLVQERSADPSRIFLLGFSQSCALNYRFAFTYPRYLRGVIGVCGGLPGDWETSERYQPTKAAIFHLAGSSDEMYSPDRISDYAARLGMRAKDVEFRTYQAGHEIVPEMSTDIHSWLERKS